MLQKKINNTERTIRYYPELKKYLDKNKHPGTGGTTQALGEPPRHWRNHPGIGEPPRHWGNPSRHWGNPPKHWGNPSRHSENINRRAVIETTTTETMKQKSGHRNNDHRSSEAEGQSWRQRPPKR